MKVLRVLLLILAVAFISFGCGGGGDGGDGGSGSTASGNITGGSIEAGEIEFTITSTNFECGPDEVESFTQTVSFIDATTMIWPDAGMTWTRNAGDPNDIRGTWRASDDESSLTLTIADDYSFTFTGTIDCESGASNIDANLVDTWNSLTVDGSNDTNRTLTLNSDGTGNSNCGGATNYTWSTSGSTFTAVGSGGCNETSICSYSISEPILTLNCTSPVSQTSTWQRS